MKNIQVLIVDNHLAGEVNNAKSICFDAASPNSTATPTTATAAAAAATANKKVTRALGGCLVFFGLVQGGIATTASKTSFSTNATCTAIS
jgi:hypothetical protein